MSRKREAALLYQRYGFVFALVLSVAAYAGAIYINGNFPTYTNPTFFRAVYGLFVFLALASLIFAAYSLKGSFRWPKRVLLLGIVCVCIYSLAMTLLAFVSVGFLG